MNGLLLTQSVSMSDSGEDCDECDYYEHEGLSPPTRATLTAAISGLTRIEDTLPDAQSVIACHTGCIALYAFCCRRVVAGSVASAEARRAEAASQGALGLLLKWLTPLQIGYPLSSETTNLARTTNLASWLSWCCIAIAVFVGYSLEAGARQPRSDAAAAGAPSVLLAVLREPPRFDLQIRRLGDNEMVQGDIATLRLAVPWAMC